MENYANPDATAHIVNHARQYADEARMALMDACIRDAYPKRYIESVRRHLDSIAKLAERRATVLAKALRP